jgi:hypothetical protein
VARTAGRNGDLKGLSAGFAGIAGGSGPKSKGFRKSVRVLARSTRTSRKVGHRQASSRLGTLVGPHDSLRLLCWLLSPIRVNKVASLLDIPLDAATFLVAHQIAIAIENLDLVVSI